jgi:diadenylate cyclase
METLIKLLFELTWYDLIDILLVSYIMVWLYSWVKGTRAFRILLGLGLLALIYFWAQYLGLFLTGRVFEWIGQATLILVIVIFATEIRQVLERINPLKMIGHTGARASDYINQIISAVEYLTRHHIGAILVFERGDRLHDLVRSGISLRGEIQREILISIFQPESPTHDGAVWIRDGSILEVAVFLPISQADLPLKYGSRHRAAVGITEQSGAIVIVVSEERGEVSIAENGVLRRVDDLDLLARELRERLHPAPAFSRPTWRSVFLKEWKVKLLALFVVTSVWFALAGQQPSELVVSVPVRYMNVPEGLQLLDAPVAEASVRLTGPRRNLVSLKPATMELRVDLARVNVGRVMVPLGPSQVIAPPDLQVMQVQPQLAQIRTERVPVASSR